ncbi:hypothetical protein ABUE38_03045 [Pediococcus parvulus]|uniref:hypothetical protein n=1 Tax=Pediococcus parvulus TaxID=54062 RepID=UPI000E8D879D|nr:hypothetical protein [Pediococcus parvulus]MCT3030007.1 hypothetical protein [Pediococcus parvulus]MCT3035002.1 hypothetical protein [Pediococcus parvulus]HBO46751.1 hypothetical protein [Pediococcus sp.]
METNDIATAFVRYLTVDAGKTRPILIVRVRNDYVLAFKITSKFSEKSRSIRKKYFQIKEWKEAGLRLPSWIDTNYAPLEISIKPVGNSIGHLTEGDRIRFHTFLANRF